MTVRTKGMHAELHKVNFYELVGRDFSNQNVWLPGLHFELRLTAFAFQIISCLLCSTLFDNLHLCYVGVRPDASTLPVLRRVILPRSQNQNRSDLFWNLAVNRGSNLIVGSQPFWFETSLPCPPQKLRPAGASSVLGSAISSCKMWRVQVHMYVVVFSHRTRCRKLISSQATRPVSGARCQTATFDAWHPHRYGLTFQVLPLAGSPRHCQAGDIYQMASICFSRVLEMEVSEIRPTTAAKESADAHLADGVRKPDLGRRAHC